ncbi:MAG: FkbM family methyltransferase [Proteobacteria bacterium]|nr:FkbM family methyltransferase [Pseudomonadota bacterium]
MKRLNSISSNSIFRSTTLCDDFIKTPLGFIDVGASGGVHPLVLPVASTTNCLCFEASSKASEELRVIEKSIFANLTVCNTIVGQNNGETDFYFTESEVNSSLRQPHASLLNRYGKKGFQIKERKVMEVRTLDSIVREVGKQCTNPGEIIKLDCQGAEYEILDAAPETLAKQCMSVWCEVEFFQVYEDQKTFSDVDRLLCSKGFSLYGLYPKYISRKMIDRTSCETNERLMWADVFYIKDPLEQINARTLFTKREIDVLIISALTTGFFDYAIEIIEAYKNDSHEKKKLLKLTRLLARREKTGIERHARQFIDRCRKTPKNIYLYAKKFIDENKNNNDVDFLTIS